MRCLRHFCRRPDCERYKWLLALQDHGVKYCRLMPLVDKSAICITFALSIIQTNNEREFGGLDQQKVPTHSGRQSLGGGHIIAFAQVSEFEEEGLLTRETQSTTWDILKIASKFARLASPSRPCNRVWRPHRMRAPPGSVWRWPPGAGRLAQADWIPQLT
jgi:hypothetical protein